MSIHIGTVFFFIGFIIAILSAGQNIAFFLGTITMAASLPAIKFFPNQTIEWRSK